MRTTDTIVSTHAADGSAAASPILPRTTAAKAVEKQESFWRDEIRIPPKAPNEPTEGINRFLLCTLVSRTAKHIKARAERVGERLPMATIIKTVLHSYQSAAKQQPGLLSGSSLNKEGLKSLIEHVMKDEIRHFAQERVKNNQARLSQASHLGDEVRIKAETEALERAVASRNRLTTEFK